MFRNSLALLTSVGVFLVASTAHALTITQTQSFTGQPNLTKAVEFSRFDPSYGTLESVEWRMSLTIEGGTLTVDNDGELPASVTVELGANGSISSPDVKLLSETFESILSGTSAVGVSTGTVFELAADNGDAMTFDPTMPDADTHIGGSASASGNGFVAPQFFSDYMGTNMFNLSVKVDQLLNFGGNGGVSGQFDPVMATPTLELIYTFVPEPASLLTASSGLVALLAWGRRRGR